MDMINFYEFMDKKSSVSQFNKTLQEVYSVLAQAGINPEDYLGYVHENNLWDENPAKVLNEINPFSAGWGAVKQGFSNMGSNRQAKGIYNLLQQAKTMPPEQLQKLGISPADIAELDKARAASAEQGKLGFWRGLGQGWENSRQQQIVNKLNKALGRTAYNAPYQQQAAQQGQAPQQGQPQQPQQGQQAVQVNPQMIQQATQHLHGLLSLFQKMAPTT